MNLRCIVVGVDGSPNARTALAWAVALAAPGGARVVAVHALGLLDRIAGETVPTSGHRAEIVATFTHDWCAPLDGAGVGNDRLALDGSPADVLLTVARDLDADLVVVGARGASTAVAGAERALGSTSHRVVTEAGRPVLVVPATTGVTDA